MAKFKNIKKFTGNIVPSVPDSPPQTQQKARRAETSAVKAVMPIASVTPEPIERKSVPEIKRKLPVAPKLEAKTVIEERPVEVKDYAPKQKEVQVLKNKPGVKPRRVGTFVLIMFFTVVLQIVLLVSLLYLSPSLIR